KRYFFTCLSGVCYVKIFIMRMHRKPHLDRRLLSCSDILFVPELADKNMKNAVLQKEYFNFAQIFGNDNPVELEIGCGFGSFICELAKRNQSVNYIAVEKISNVVISAAERAKKEGITNVFFLNCAAEILPKYIPVGAVEKIYLNFSTPLPKLGYAKQRLTHPRFLEEYKLLLAKGGTIVQKTDDRDFYLFSLESYRQCGFEIVESCADLKALADPENIVTEYEQKFMDCGKNIYRIIAKN
ncbi:MAG: tRNA (guanosine(46)-N7)-methyltransferase TrmB, partial [Candidatus Coproplasma sp.]